MDTTNLSDKAFRILSYICRYQEKNGFAPTVSEIMRALEIRSVRGAIIQLEKLQNFGYIERIKNSPRAIRILVRPKEERKTVKLPLVGEVRAGEPVLAEHNIEEYLDVPLSHLHGRQSGYLLKVNGTSMNKAGFYPGDVVVVVDQPSPTHGDIVVAYDEDTDSATLKRFKRVGDFFFLWPESSDPSYKPIAGTGFVIQGKVVDKLN